MLLAIDIGNSNIGIGCIEDHRILFRARIATDLVKTSDQYCVELKNMLNLFHVDTAQITGSIISSVVPPVLNALKCATQRLTGKNSIIIGPGIKTGLNIAVDHPSQVGADLIVAAVGALHIWKPPLIIVDMGTATTVSVVDEKCSYIGGCICPGLQVSLDSLSERTAQLPGISLERPKRVIGKNTVDCMRSGVLFGTAGMIDTLVQRMQDELRSKATVVATGGLAPFVVPLCQTLMHYEDDLIYKGLEIIYQYNTKGTEAGRKNG